MDSSSSDDRDSSSDSSSDSIQEMDSSSSNSSSSTADSVLERSGSAETVTFGLDEDISFIYADNSDVATVCSDSDLDSAPHTGSFQSHQHNAEENDSTRSVLFSICQ